MAAITNVYFDESGTHRASRLMSLAGYWFDQQQAARFARDWAKDLRAFGLSHAHMTDCALGFGEYRQMTKAQRVKVQTLLIEHIKRRTRFGFGVCMSADAYDNAIGGIPGAPSAYTWCLMLCLNQVANFAAAIGYEGKIAYFFEAGHAKANEAQKFMNHIPREQVLVDAHRYAAHAFVDKKIALPLQAADMFAWHLRHYYERCLDGIMKPRADYVALHRPFDFQALVSKTHILALRETFLRYGPLIQEGQMEQAAQVGDDILREFGLGQKPVYVPKNTPIGKGPRSDKRIIRF